MISKERLEELIEQGATVYSEQFRENIELSKCIQWEFFKSGFVWCIYKDRELIINLERLFEKEVQKM